MYIKIKGGTPDHHGSQDLCITCRKATIIEGRSMREYIKSCHAICDTDARIPETVTRCSSYDDKRQASVREMEQIAWLVKTDASKKAIGFAPMKDLTEAERKAWQTEKRHLPGFDDF